VISTDLFPALAPHLREGRMVATLHQRPFTQGRLAFQQLWEYLAEGRKPPETTKVLPHLVMRSNLEALIESAGAGPGEPGEAESKILKAG
jgi:LacI family transcriptional regulator